MLRAVEHRFGVACTHRGGLRAENGHNVADGISTLSVGIGCARADAVGTVERDGLFRHVCVCVVCGSPAMRCMQCHRACEEYPQPAAMHV